MWYNAAVHEWTIKEMIKAEHRVTLTLFNVFSFKASLIFRKSSGSPCGTQGPLYVSSHPSISIFPLSSLFSPLPGSPQLRRPGAFRPDTHTCTATHTRTLTPTNGRSRKCLIPVLEWCHYASLTRRLQDLSPERETGAERESQTDGERCRTEKGWKIDSTKYFSPKWCPQKIDSSESVILGHTYWPNRSNNSPGILV